MKPNRSAFTLVELLVVVAVVSLLMGLLLPSLSRARLTAQGVVCASNMRQIALAALGYAVDHADRYPRTMIPPAGGIPETINFWDVRAYQTAIEPYLDASGGGVGSDGVTKSRVSVWYDPVDPDQLIPAMWGSFEDNGLITGAGVRIAAIKRPSRCVFAALRHRDWSAVVGVPVPSPLPVEDPEDAFWQSEFFDMCLDPWSDSTDPSDAYHWQRGKAAPPIELFPNEPGASEWAQQIDGRNPEIAPDGLSRYGNGSWYSFCDGHVAFMKFEETYESVSNNMWSIR